MTTDASALSAGGLRAGIQRVGDRLVEAFATVALFVIGGTIVWSAVHVYVAMIHAGTGRLDDILLLAVAVLLLRIADSRFAPPLDRGDIR